MDWFILAISAFVISIACLCKVYRSSKFPNFDSGDTLQLRAVLLVIAHPDDESMFFAPTINHLISRGHNVHVLCLSTGNADGKGNVRKDELYKACATLKIPRKQVTILDLPELQDGFDKLWNHTLIAKMVEDSVKTHGIDLVIAFDGYGVSGHCNHRDVYFGVRKFLLGSQQNNLEAWQLDSINILRKYTGPYDIWTSIVLAWWHPGGKVVSIVNEHPLRGFQAMTRHKSQLVWFRKLFVCLSSYTYVNTLRRIEI